MISALSQGGPARCSLFAPPIFENDYIVPGSDTFIETYIALGSNLGDRLAHLQAAVQAFDRHGGVRVRRTSPVYETRAHTLAPGEYQPDYLNAVVHVDTSLSAEDLLHLCQEIEHKEGRDRANEPRWAPRTLDLDILLYGQVSVSTGKISVPHPRMGERRFVLCPLADLAPNLLVPSPYEKTVAELLASCPDPDEPQRTAFRLE